MTQFIRSVLLLLSLSLTGVMPAMATEEPKYALVEKQGGFEIRQYDAMIVAETTINGRAVNARNAGFQPLADYIFAKDRKGGSIAMTAPVTQTRREQIAMTAPVTQQASGDSWTISFIMPAEYTMANLPAPADPRVRLTPQPARRMAVVRFSGSGSTDEMERARLDLMKQISARGLTTRGEVVFAFYDPPWTLPMFRRNEVMIELVSR